MRTKLIVTALLLVASASAHAESSQRPQRIPTKARELADKGRAFHDAGEYNAAVDAFKEAYVLAPSPGLLFNIAQSYRLAGNCDESAWMYRRFLDSDPQGDRRRIAQQHLGSVEKCGSGGLRFSVTPLKLEAKVPSPPATSRMALHKSVDRPAPSGRRLKHVGIGVATGGGAILLGAAVFALDARDASNTVEQTYRDGGKWDDVKQIDARGERSATIAKVLGIGGGVAVVTGAALYAFGRHYESARHVAITPTTRGAQVSLSWGF